MEVEDVTNWMQFGSNEVASQAPRKVCKFRISYFRIPIL